MPLATKDGRVLVRLYVVPRANKTRVTGLHDNQVKLQVAAPPVDGKANLAIIKHLAKVCGVRKTSVELVAGEASRRKTLAISDVAIARVAQALGLGGYDEYS